VKGSRLRVLAIASHPVQYLVPIFRLMAQHPRLDFHVAYCSLRGAEAGYDPEFGATVKWDVPLLDGYSWTHIPNRVFSGQSFTRLCNLGLWPLIRGGKLDAILCYASYRTWSFWIAYLAAKLSRTAFLFGTDTTTLTPLDQRMWKRHVKRIAWPLLFRLADQVIVPSSGTRDLMASLGIPDERVTLTPYTVDNDWWTQRAKEVDRDAVRAKWGTKRETVVILFCAKLQPWKRPSDLLRAFAKADAPNVILVLAGDGPLRPALEAQADSLGLRDRVRFAGFFNQTQLPEVYTAADLLVLPSLYDAFGVVVNEALLCGCPVAASSHVGATRDLIAPISPDFVFPCGDIDALAAILSNAARDPARLREIGRRGIEHMRTWTPQRNVSATLEAIEHSVLRLSRATAGSAATSPRSDAVQRDRPKLST
jgi:glycosyltransferase involved in cell wall biosynthesis